MSEATIRRTDNDTVCTMHYRADRLEAFVKMSFDDQDKRHSLGCPTPMDPMPGLSGRAILGLDTIFADIPYRFPVDGIVEFLCREAMLPCPEEVERRLECMWHKYPALDHRGNDRKET